MKFKVDGWNNFCRVFQYPDEFSEEFCFGGGHDTVFKMVDWFNPVEGLSTPACSKEVWLEKVGGIEVIETTTEELSSKIIPWLREKEYTKKDKTYLVLCDFGAAITFKGEKA